MERERERETMWSFNSYKHSIIWLNIHVYSGIKIQVLDFNQTTKAWHVFTSSPLAAVNAIATSLVLPEIELKSKLWDSRP